MKEIFHKFKKLYQDNLFDELLKEEGSVYWLKLRSITRKHLMLEFCRKINFDPTNVKAKDLFEVLFILHPAEATIDEYIDEKYLEERSVRKSNEIALVSELYKMKILDWGGIYQNNLEKTLVDNYIKRINNFDLLSQKVDNEIHSSVRGYVLSSWYNHWTSILIEDVFKDHSSIIPTVGLIKKVDFFVKNVPFDLKVTYFPEGYMLAKRKELGLPKEIKKLKDFAKENNISFNKTLKEKEIVNELYLKISERNDEASKNFIIAFKSERAEIVRTTIENKKDLIKWLYEEQGERRFDAANRLFLVLIDSEAMEDSWKMKRNIDLLKDGINQYLDGFDEKKMNELDIKFNWLDGKEYSTQSDAIFILK